MRQANVFDWAQVKLAEECLTVLFKANGSKQNVVAQLASAGGVSAAWDEDGLVKLEGPWDHILKSQTVFENYIRKLSESSSFKNISKPNDEQKKIERIMIRNPPSKIIIPNENLITEGNEVYVNITLSHSEHTNLDHKPVGAVQSICEDNLEKRSRSNHKKNKNLCIRNSEFNVLGSSNLNESGTDRHSPKEMKVLKRKQGIDDKSDSHHGDFHSSCNTPAKSCGKYVDTNGLVIESSWLHEEQHVNNIPSVINSDDKIGNSIIIPIPSDNEPKKINSDLLKTNSQAKDKNSSCDLVVNPLPQVFSKISQKCLKKKYYEELAPFKFFCSLCSFKSKRESHFTKHMKLHNAVSELFKCTQCTFTSIRLSHLRRHELSHSKLALFCSLCQYHTNNQKLLIRHKRIKHSAKQVSESDIAKDMLHCVHCEYQTGSYSFLQRHMKIHETDSSVQIYQCEQCSYKTSRKEHFVRHTNNIHKGQRPFLCHQCGKAFKRQDALKQHDAVHSTPAAIPCPECGKGCRSQAHLSQHMSVHSSEKLFLCELCGACFKTRAVQRKHVITIHQHPKAFLCSHCSQKFNTKFALKRHTKQHSFLFPVQNKIKHDPQVSTSTSISNSINVLKIGDNIGTILSPDS